MIDRENLIQSRGFPSTRVIVGPETPPADVSALLSIPRHMWPGWAGLVARRRKPEDIGVGSTIERELGRLGQTFKSVLEALGVPCGCAERKEEFDRLYPYSPDDRRAD